MLKTGRCAPLRGEWHCLDGEKEPRIAETCGNLGEPQDLKTPFHRAGTPRPIPYKTRGLAVGFAEKAVVKRDGAPVSGFFKRHTAVEGAPVELPLEVLSEAALAGAPVPCHRQTTESSVYCQYQNHCLGEETFKIFSYLRSPVESRRYNRSYLVKWLNFIHNLLVYSFKIMTNLALDQILLTLILLIINDINMFYSIFSILKIFNELL
ncbi:MAG: hypothetical protein HDR88_07695 [Bacteroides sp.]|nr:hypothetical protein [Bacteroides sp.]